MTDEETRRRRLTAATATAFATAAILAAEGDVAVDNPAPWESADNLRRLLDLLPDGGDDGDLAFLEF